jgi:hypothetical protein
MSPECGVSKRRESTEAMRWLGGLLVMALVAAALVIVLPMLGVRGRGGGDCDPCLQPRWSRPHTCAVRCLAAAGPNASACASVRECHPTGDGRHWRKWKCARGQGLEQSLNG